MRETYLPPKHRGRLAFETMPAPKRRWRGVVAWIMAIGVFGAWVFAWLRYS